MALSPYAWGHDGGTYSGEDMRQMVEAILGGGSGVTGDDEMVVAEQGSPDATVKVSAGRCVITADGAGLGGCYVVWNDADLTSPAFTPTAGSGRKDFLILTVDGTTGEPELMIVEGTPSGSPAEPTITEENYEVLALITLPPSTTNIDDSMIEDRRQVLPAAPLLGEQIDDIQQSVEDAIAEFPLGVIGYDEITSQDSMGSSGTEDVDGLSVTVNVGDGSRRIKVTLYCPGVTNGDARIREGGNTLQRAFANTWGTNNAAGTVVWSGVPSAGNHTYKASSQRSSSGAWSAHAENPSFLLVEDLGAA